MTSLTGQVKEPVKTQQIELSTQRTSNITTTYSTKKKEKELQDIKMKMLKGVVPYMVADSGATSSCGRPNDPFIKTGQPSTKIFHTPFGQVAQATETAQLQYKIRAPANTIDIIPGLKHSALLSINKLAKAKYVTVFMPDKVNIFDGSNTKITST